MTERETRLEKIVFAIFSSMIFVICYFLFLFCYDVTFHSSDDYVPGRLVTFFYHLLICAVAVVVAVILKLVLKKKIRLKFLLPIAILLPVLCFGINYHTLKEDGLFYPVVDDGGIFHFIAIGDFDLDGMNDEEHHRLYEERVYAMSYTDLVTDEIKRIDTEAQGIGSGLNGCYADYDGEKRTVTLHLNKKWVELKEMRLEFFFADPSSGESFSLYMPTHDGEILIEHTLGERGTAFVIFDTDTCLNWQNQAEGEYIRIPLRYDFEGR